MANGDSVPADDHDNGNEIGNDDDNVVVHFRAAKRRKVYRRPPSPQVVNDEYGRANALGLEQSSAHQESSLKHSPNVEGSGTNHLSPTDSSFGILPLDHESKSSNPPSTSAEAPATSSPNTSVAQLIRQRMLQHRKRHVVEFGLAASSSALSNGSRQTAEPIETASGNAMAARFARQTGQVVIDDKHMTAYIDAAMSRRTESSSSPLLKSKFHSEPSNATAPVGSDQSQHRQPATLGKLQEIDLGPEARARNMAAIRAAQNPQSAEEQQREAGLATAQAREVRLARIGRPGRRGRPALGRKRRNSEDLRRDQIVEDLLKENRIELYDESSASEPDKDESENDARTSTGPDIAAGSADDRFAERFRRAYLDAQQANRRPAAPAPPTARGEIKDERPKGPKLGGSRSARAAMRERELADKKSAGSKR